MSNRNNELLLIPKYEKYMQYMIDVILKLPRTEKFNIGNEYKYCMYENLRNIMIINKVEAYKRLEYLNYIDANMNSQRILLRIMYKNKYIDEKKFKVSIEQIYEIGKIIGGLQKYYGKNNKK